MSLLFKLKNRYTKFIFNLSASENRLYLLFYKYLYKPRKGSIQYYIDRYSRNNKPISFLQIGANDGFVYDPLHKFIKRDNWSGVMLEPLPDVFNNYLSKLHSKRPEIKTINAALDVADGFRPLYKIALSNKRWATGLSSFYKEVLISKLNSKRFLKYVKREGITLPENIEEIVVAENIPTICPETLLEMFDNKGIKLLAVDTEGFDFEILKMLNLARISPEIILYEEVNFDESTVKECRSYIEKHGYKLLTIKKDVIAIRNDIKIDF